MLKLNSFRDLRSLDFGPVIHIQRAGGFYKARWQGSANSVFGATVEEAKRRLLNTPSNIAKNSRRSAEIRERNWAYGFRG